MPRQLPPRKGRIASRGRGRAPLPLRENRATEELGPATGGSKKKGHRGFFAKAARYSGAEFVGNLAQDVGETAVGVGPGLFHTGRALVTDNVNMVLHPRHAEDYNIGSGKRSAFAKEVVKPTLAQYRNTYGHGFKHFASEFYEHPLGPVLDALTVADLGATSGVRLGLLSGERAAFVTRSPTHIAEGRGPVHVELSSSKPLVRGRQKLVRRATGVEGFGAGKVRVGGELKRHGKLIQRDAELNALGRLTPYQPYLKARRRLSEDEWAALHIRARDVHPDDLADLWKGTPNGKVLTADVKKLALQPSKRMLRAEGEARLLSKEGEALYTDNGILHQETADERPSLFRRQASGLLGREARVIHGDPYYIPDTLEPPRNVSPLNVAGGGKAVPRKPGSTKMNMGVLALSGKLHLRSDVLGPEFLRRVKYLKYGEIHQALLGGAVRVTREQIEQNFGGKLPVGYEYVRTWRRPTVPAAIRAEGDVKVPIADAGRPAAVRRSIDEPTQFGQPEPAAPVVSDAARLAALEKRHQEFQTLLEDELLNRNAKLDRGQMAEQREKNTKAGKIAQRDTGLTKEGKVKGSSSPHRGRAEPTVNEELRRQAQDYFEEYLTKHSEEPVVKQFLAERAEMDALRAKAQPNPETLFSTEKAIPDADDLHDSQLAKDGFTTTEQAQAHKTGEHYYIVPSSTVKAAVGEFTRSSDFVHTYVKKPLMVWRSAVLGLRPGFFTNNLVGNSILYAVATGGKGGLRDLFMSILETHGAATAKKALDSPATPAGLKADLYREFFPDQAHGTFGRTQSPAASKLGSASNKVAGAWNATTGALPKVTSKVAEETPRRALIRHYIRRSPEFKKIHDAMPKQTRSFEAAARVLLEGKGGRGYQRLISKQVNNALGDYLHMTPFERNVVRNLLPFYAWYKAITTVTLHLAADTPLRANILFQLGQVGKQHTDKALGEIPSFLEGAIPFGGGQPGMQRVVSTQGANPYATLEQLRRGLLVNYEDAGANPFLISALRAVANAPTQGVSPPQILAQTLEDVGRSLPLSRVVAPKPPSALYPYRDRRSELEGFFGVPIKDYRPGVAKAQAREGR